jgi:general secretion pathway protein C
MFFLDALRKYIWIGRYLVIALCAYLSANAVSIYVRGALSNTPVLNLSTSVAPVTATKSLNDYDIVLKRSLFNSAGVNMEASFTAKDQGPAVTTDDFQLLGVLAGDPAFSFAVINTRHDGKTEVYRIGDKVADTAEITAIRSREVELLHNGARKVISLPEWGDGTAKTGNRWAKGSGTQVADGIRKMADNQFQVDEKVVQGAFENMAGLLRDARIAPNIENGKINGFKVMRVKKGGFYGQIGLQNGDIIHRVNSLELKGPEDGLQLFSELKTAKNIKIDITRNGQRQTLSYSVK